MRSISGEKRTLVLEKCRQTSILLQEVQPALIPWAVEKGSLEQRFIDALSKIKEQARKFPGGWVPLTAGQLAACWAFRDPARIEEYHAGHGRSLSSGAAALFHLLEEQPAFFTAFGVEKALGDDLFEIRDYSSGKSRMLFSPALGERVRNEAESYQTLLFSNGLCLQAIGPLHYYRGLASADFHYYAVHLAQDLYEQSGLSEVMSEMPESFVILDAYTEIPFIAHGGQLLYCCSSQFTAASLDPSALSSAFDVEEADGRFRFRLKGSNPPFTNADLFWNPSDQDAFIYTRNLQDYDKVVRALAGQAEAPREPLLTCTQNMEVIVRSLLGIEPAVLEWDAPFEPPPAGPEEKAAMRRINALLGDLTDAANHGRTYDLEKMAARHGVSPEDAREMEEVIKNQERSMAIDVPGGLAGVPALPPSGRMRMREDLLSCSLFRFSTADEAQRLFATLAARVDAMRPKKTASRTRTMLTLATLPAVLEEIDDPPGERDTDHTVLKYSMYLLCRAGSEFHGTEDYAAEILRLFWQFLVPSRERAGFRRFVRQYAIWCRELLVRAGLAEDDGQATGITPGAPFQIRATPFFKAWSRLGRTS
jgi:hypothetical protein